MKHLEEREINVLIAKNLVANNTSNAQIARIDSSPDLVKIESTQMDFDRPQEASSNSLSKPSRLGADFSPLDFGKSRGFTH